MAGAEEKDENDAAAEIAKVVGTRIAVRREAIGLSQEDLADRAGLHRTTISPLELGKRSLRVTTLFHLAGVLGVPPGQLLDGFYWVPDGSGDGHFTNTPPSRRDP
jgi:transcriptional regulator with XRE-family HTH domain